MLRPILTASVASILALLAAPAIAQDSGERVNQLIVYGSDPCPASSDTEITVCARKDEAERYRIPEPLRQTPSPQNDAWNNRVVAYETVGKFGTLSCSPVGGGGHLGCTQKLIDDAYAERRGGADVRFGQLIAEERARRTATIDAEAAETQKRVEEIEKQMDERARKEAEGTAPAPAPAPAP